MFERRLRIFLVFLAIVTSVLIARAVQLQLVEHDHWAREVITSTRHDTFTETTRGKLLDCKGRTLAFDEPSMDASVKYGAIIDEPEPKLVHDTAVDRIETRNGKKYRYTKAELKDESEQVKADIVEMWRMLARQGDMNDDEMNDLRHSIVERVEQRRRHLWYRKQQKLDALTPAGNATTMPSDDVVQAWLNDDRVESPFDGFDIRVAEQDQAHVILRAIDGETYNRLGKLQERLPFLVLAPRMERHYPFNEVACHVIGQLQPVNAADVNDDSEDEQPLRAYHNNDLIGRGGLEELCEPLLRGSRGRDQEEIDSNGAISKQHDDMAPGRDINSTIDIDLQKDIEQAFKHLNVKRKGDDPDLFADMHGAAVIIDVASGDVRALVSAPGFDLNTLNEHNSALLLDDLNHPLVNRATMAMIETGSIIKPVVGIGAITSGKMTVTDTVKCDGFFHHDGVTEEHFRCWTKTEWDNPGHGPPLVDPHPTGLLTFSDALQRSCNVFFETMGDRLDVTGLAYWMRTFGLGRITGIGVSEYRGRLPGLQSSKLTGYARRKFSWADAIGQKEVAATPIQMANVAATIARNGVWMRPRLVDDSISQQLRGTSTTRPSDEKTRDFDWTAVPDRQELPLNPAAVAAAQDGMYRVVNTFAGTGNVLFNPDLEISGKTGTAEAAALSVLARDADGKIEFDGKKPRAVMVQPSLPNNVNPRAPWYLAFWTPDVHKNLTISFKHSWFIGYFPSKHPTIAFAVLVEYGGGGSGAAGTIANQVIKDCVDRGYASLDSKPHDQVP